MAALDLQLAIERAGGICLTLEFDGSVAGWGAAMERVVDALGGIDIIVVPDARRAAEFLAAMDGLPRRVRPGWVLADGASDDLSPASLLKGPRVAWVLDSGDAPEDIARQALDL